MAVIAGLFDSEADATMAMDELLRKNLSNLETRVVGGGSSNTDAASGPVLPLSPNMGSTNIGQPGAAIPVSGSSAYGDVDWLDSLDDVERAFYHEGLKEGGILAVAKVDDEDAAHVRLALSKYGARTYQVE